MDGQLAILFTSFAGKTTLGPERFDGKAEAVAAAQRERGLLARQPWERAGPQSPSPHALELRDVRVVRVVDEKGRRWEPVDWEVGT